MDFLFQLLIIFFVGLIAYWWANQGAFSAILHFLSVVAAGAIAFAVWEPLVVGVLLTNSFFDQYAWGAGLVGVFCIVLFLLRVSFDKLAPANVQLPHSTNLLIGGVFGVASGILSVGITMIGIGFLQSSNELMGVKSYARSSLGVAEESPVWIPVHKWTADFYEFLSDGALRPDFEGEPLALAKPNVDRLAFSLIRDTYSAGTSRVSIPPDAVTINKVEESDDRIFVTFTVNNRSYDHSQMFVMSPTQIRLIGRGLTGGVETGFPDRWTQEVRGSRTERTSGDFQQQTFIFDDPSHFVTSVPGQSESTIEVEFPKGNSEWQFDSQARPMYVEIKAVRFHLPAVEQVAGMARGIGESIDRMDVPVDGNAPFDNGQAIQLRHDVRPLNVSINAVMQMNTNDARLLTDGRMAIPKSAARGNRNNRVEGFFATSGTRIVQVDASRDSICSIEGPIREQVGDDAAPVLVDAAGNVYYAKGYFVERPNEVEISLTPNSLIRSLRQLPNLPSNNTHKLRLVYEITEGVQLQSFRLGDVTVARTNLVVQ